MIEVFFMLSSKLANIYSAKHRAAVIVGRGMALPVSSWEYAQP